MTDKINPVINGNNEYFESPQSGNIYEYKAVKRTDSFVDRPRLSIVTALCKNEAELDVALIRVLLDEIPDEELFDALKNYIHDKVVVRDSARHRKSGYSDYLLLTRRGGNQVGFIGLPDDAEINPTTIAEAYFEDTGKMRAVEKGSLSVRTLCDEGYLDTTEYLLASDFFKKREGLKTTYTALYIPYSKIIDKYGDAMPENVENCVKTLKREAELYQDYLDGVNWIVTEYRPDLSVVDVYNEDGRGSRARLDAIRKKYTRLGSFRTVKDALTSKAYSEV